MLAMILQTLTEQQCHSDERQDRLQAEQARMQEAQMIMFQEMRQQ
jgi:predicted nucleic acid-binding Zn ribbon protein